jgi:hypothetical protein
MSSGIRTERVEASWEKSPCAFRPECCEVKVRGNGFRKFYAWLEHRDFLIVRADRSEPLVVIPLRLAAEIAAAAEKGRGS